MSHRDVARFLSESSNSSYYSTRLVTISSRKRSRKKAILKHGHTKTASSCWEEQLVVVLLQDQHMRPWSRFTLVIALEHWQRYNSSFLCQPTDAVSTAYVDSLNASRLPLVS